MARARATKPAIAFATVADMVTWARLSWRGGTHVFKIEASEPPGGEAVGGFGGMGGLSAMQRDLDRLQALQRGGGHTPALLHDRAGAILKRLGAGLYGHNDVAETIRCGLIGGGDLPPGKKEWEQAKQLVIEHVLLRPLTESVPLAQAILAVTLYGLRAEIAEAGMTPDQVTTALAAAL